MGDIYTPPWYEDVKAAINTKVVTMLDVPKGTWHCKIEIVSDGLSPYVEPGEERHFLVRIDDGKCDWYREVDGDDPDVELDYRFRGPATTFDEIAAGVADPIDAALRGWIKVRGDMRFLMRQADHVKVLLEAYSNGVETSWPQGRPPYQPAASEVASA